MSAMYQIKIKNILGQEVSLKDYEGKYLLVVNLASRCGFTKQYEGLEKLHEDLSHQGISILGFPCNQFGGQEPDTEEEILEGCVLKYGVQFPMFSKIEVNGEGAHELYQFLKSEPKFAEDVQWNFEKFLVSPQGEVIKRYPSSTPPSEIQQELSHLVS